MSNQFVQITFPNGDVFLVPFHVIAVHRTEYYAEKEGWEVDSPEWAAEYLDSMQVSEVYDWIQNNMNWEDVEEFAILQPKTEEQSSHRSMWHDVSIETVTK